MEWLPIETAPEGHVRPREMFVVRAFGVQPPGTKSVTYTSDPWCTWRTLDGGFARWPHPFEPTHWMPLPLPPEPT